MVSAAGMSPRGSGVGVEVEHESATAEEYQAYQEELAEYRAAMAKARAVGTFDHRAKWCIPTIPCPACGVGLASQYGRPDSPPGDRKWSCRSKDGRGRGSWRTMPDGTIVAKVAKPIAA